MEITLYLCLTIRGWQWRRLVKEAGAIADLVAKQAEGAMKKDVNDAFAKLSFPGPAETKRAGLLNGEHRYVHCATN